MKFRNEFALLLLVFSFLDAIFTLRMISVAGLSVELNPLLYLALQHGFYTFWIVKFAIFAPTTWLLWKLSPERDFAYRALRFFGSIYGAVVATQIYCFL